MEDIIPLLGSVTAAISAVIGLLSFYKSRKNIESELKKIKASVQFARYDESEEQLRNATEALLTSLKDTDDAVVQLGAFLLIKHSDDNGKNIDSMILTDEQLSYLESNPKMLSKPTELLLRLKEFQLSIEPISVRGVVNTSNNKLQTTQKVRG